MSIKRILVLASGRAGDASALAFAAWLAGQHDAVVDVVPVYPDASGDLLSLGMALGATISPEAIDTMTAAEHSLQSRLADLAQRAASEADVVYGPGDGPPRLVVRPRSLNPSLSVSRQSALSDLTVIGQDSLTTGPGQDWAGQVLLVDRAALLVARGDPDRLSGPAAIAWDGSPQAGRAVRAALPLLAMASSIHILQHEITGRDDQAGGDIDRLNTYLDLHGVGQGLAAPLEGHDEGLALISAAERLGAGLFVAGAWGHSRLRETVFGGATRSFLQRRDGPTLLLAH